MQGFWFVGAVVEVVPIAHIYPEKEAQQSSDSDWYFINMSDMRKSQVTQNKSFYRPIKTKVVTGRDDHGRKVFTQSHHYLCANEQPAAHYHSNTVGKQTMSCVTLPIEI